MLENVLHKIQEGAAPQEFGRRPEIELRGGGRRLNDLGPTGSAALRICLE